MVTGRGGRSGELFVCLRMQPDASLFVQINSKKGADEKWSNCWVLETLTFVEKVRNNQQRKLRCQH